MPRIAAEMEAVTSPSGISLMRAPAARISSIRSWWRGRSRMIVVMSLGVRPKASAIALHVVDHRAAEVDLAARGRPDGHLPHVHVRQGLDRVGLADDHHRHRAVAAARHDRAAALQRDEREVDRAAAGRRSCASSGSSAAVEHELAARSGAAPARAPSPPRRRRAPRPGRRGRASARRPARPPRSRGRRRCRGSSAAVAAVSARRVGPRSPCPSSLAPFRARQHELHDATDAVLDVVVLDDRHAGLRRPGRRCDPGSAGSPGSPAGTCRARGRRSRRRRGTRSASGAPPRPRSRARTGRRRRPRTATGSEPGHDVDALEHHRPALLQRALQRGAHADEHVARLLEEAGHGRVVRLLGGAAARRRPRSSSSGSTA